MGTALLLVDVINDLAFQGSAPLVGQAEAMAGPLARLVDRARRASVPVIYVNDNFGRRSPPEPPRGLADRGGARKNA